VLGLSSGLDVGLFLFWGAASMTSPQGGPRVQNKKERQDAPRRLFESSGFTLDLPSGGGAREEGENIFFWAKEARRGARGAGGAGPQVSPLPQNKGLLGVVGGFTGGLGRSTWGKKIV